MNESLSLKQLEDFREKHGKRGATTLSLLGKMVGFVEAIKSPWGFELLKDDIARMEELLEKVVSETASPQEMAEFRYLKNDRLPKISNRIAQFIKMSQQVVEGSKNDRNEKNT